jgi:hypothetical protein
MAEIQDGIQTLAGKRKKANDFVNGFRIGVRNDDTKRFSDPGGGKESPGFEKKFPYYFRLLMNKKIPSPTTMIAPTTTSNITGQLRLRDGSGGISPIMN